MVLSSMTSLLLHQKERFITGAFNDIVKTTTALDTISEDTLAAILVPLIDDDDLVLATPAYLDFLALRARHAGALLIVDETTSSRIAPQGICRTVGVEPDLIVVGDWIGGGLPIGAVLGRRGIMDSTSSMILDTPGQTLCLAASLSTLQRSDAEYIAKLNKLGEDLRARLGTIFGNDESRIITNTSTSKSTLPSSPTHDILSDDSGSAIRITGVGSLTQIHFRGLQAEQLQPLFWYHMLSHGFLLGTSGRVDLNGRTSDECLVRFELAAKKFVEQYNILP